MGNRNYRYYNKIVDLVDTTLQELGARRIGTVGKADEAKGGRATDEDFLEWSNSMLERFGELFGIEKRPMVYSPELDVVAADPKTEVMEMRNWTEEEAERYVMEDMKKSKRLQEDVWSG